MPDTTSPGDEPEPTGKAGPKKMILTVLLAVVLLGVGYVLGGKMGGGGGAAVAEESTGSSESTEGAEDEAEEAEHHVGVVIDLDAVNVNLADGHYLRVAVSLGLSPDVDFGHGSADDFSVAAASDVVLHTFSGRGIDELATAEGREAARLELVEGLAPHYGEDVVFVYYTEFVMQ